MLSLDDRTLELLFTAFRMRRLFGFRNKKLANPPVLEVNAGRVAIQALNVWLAN
jgi:hypothetical protein